jgi:UDP-hydrolysing UDP-N-acetyl-D-glucosamine 2-epimerase
MDKIVFISSTRADFGLLLPLINELNERPEVDLQIIATGTHLSETHGKTISEIQKSVSAVIHEVSIWSNSDDPLTVALDVGSAVDKFARKLDEINPSAIIILGDRLEILAAAISAIVQGIFIVHIHGGEKTTGAMDDSIRHAITKLSNLHFATTNEHAERIIRMGENPESVFNLGLPFLDTLASKKDSSLVDIEEKFQLIFGKNTGLITFHPASYEKFSAEEFTGAITQSVNQLLIEFPDLNFIITGTNNDINSPRIRAALKDLTETNPKRIFYVESFGHENYLSVLGLVDFVFGNSSSFVLEAPITGTPAVILGDRQSGRYFSDNVFKVSPNSLEICEVVRKIITGAILPISSDSPYGKAGFAKKAAKIIMETKFIKFQGKIYYDSTT